MWVKKMTLLLFSSLWALCWAQGDSQPSQAQLKGGQVTYFSESKMGPQHPDKCEDGFFFNDQFLVVVDGASDKSGRVYDGHTGGWHCKEAVLTTFRELKGDESKVEIVGSINKRVQQLYKRFGVDPLVNPEYRFSGVLIWYNYRTNALYAVGDCKARVDGATYNAEEKMVDRLNSEFRVRVLEELEVELSQAQAKDLGRDYIKPLLKAQTRYQNNPDAPEGLQYWVVDGTSIPAGKIKMWGLPGPPKVIELSSDGYAEFPKESSVEAYEKKLKALLKEDPTLTHRVMSTKGLKEGYSSFDDRTILIYRAK